MRVYVCVYMCVCDGERACRWAHGVHVRMQQSELERDTFNFETYPSFWNIYCEFHCHNQLHCIQLSAQVRSNAHGKDKEFGHGRDAGLRHEKRKTRAPQVS